MDEASDQDRLTVIDEVTHEVKDAFWDRQKVQPHKYHIDDMDANVQGLFHEDIRAITLTLFLLWSVTNLVYYGTIFGIEVRTEKFL